MAEMLAAYTDNILRKGGAKIREDQFDDKIKMVV